MCGMVGLVAGRVSAPGTTNVVAAAPAPRVVQTFVAVAPTPVIDEPPAADAEPDDDGLDLANVLASAKQQAAELVHTHEAIRGHITDPSGQGLAGVTVIVTGGSQAMTAVTDDHGDYEVVNLPSASYLVAFYYADQSLERPGIATREIEPTQLDVSIDPNFHPRYEPGDTAIDLPVARTFDAVVEDYDANIPDSEDDVNIVVPGRTFEAALGAAAGSQEDGTGISFSGGTYLDVVDQ
jgi:hypothetical protein